MNLLSSITIGIIILGFIVLFFIKRNIDRKQTATIQSKIWLIVGTTAWGVVSIFLWVSSFKGI